MQSEGKNYLIPVDANILRENEIEDQAVSFDLLIEKLVWAKNNLNIVILDACRNNPFAKSWSDSRSIGELSGLARTDTPKGTVILYATEQNSF